MEKKCCGKDVEIGSSTNNVGMCSLCGTLYCVKNKKLQRVNLENEAVVGKCSVCGDDLVGWEVELYSTKCVICTAVDG